MTTYLVLLCRVHSLTDISQPSLGAALTGMDWAVKDIKSKGAQKKSVLNISFGFRPPNPPLDNAILAAYNEGILTVVAAGNDDQPVANDTSPQRLPEAFIVGMTQADRARAY